MSHRASFALLALCGGSLLALPATAHAQETAERRSTSGEIVVTAQRRAQAAMDVPISVQAFDAEALAERGVTNTQELTNVVPGLNFSLKGLFTQPVIRGISTQGTGVDGAVATYIDGVYMAGAGAGVFQMSDVESVEVLKGPQGTLYGRNATGGALLLRTRRPDFEFGGNASLSYGTFDDTEAQIFLTGPLIGDTLAVSFAGMHRTRDAFVDDLLRGGKIGDVESWGARLSLRLRLTENIDFTLSGFQMSVNDPTVYASGIAYNQNSLSRRVAPALPIATQPYTSTIDAYPQLETWVDGAILNGTISLGIGDLTSTTGYVRSWGRGTQDADGGPAFANHVSFAFPSTQQSQEFSLATREFGNVSFVLGAMYFHQDHASDLLVGGNTFRIKGYQENTAYAVYGEADWAITDRLSFVGGARYSEETRSYRGYSDPGTSLDQTPTTLRAAAETTWSDVTPRASLIYEASENTNVYVTYSEGFKSGTYNPTSLITTPAEPESISSIEIGLKTQFRSSTFNLALFDLDYQNMQVATTVTTGAVTQSFLRNAASARVRGIEFDATVWLTDSFRISGGASHLFEHEFQDFPDATVNVPYAPADCPVGVWPCGNFSTVADLSGTPLTRTPETTATLSAEYLVRVAGELRFSANLYYNSGFEWDLTHRIQQPAYTTLNGSVTWTPDALPIEVALWGRNLTDEAYQIQSADSAGGDMVSFAVPRQVGVRIGYRF